MAAYTTIQIDTRFGSITHDFLKKALFFNELSMDTARVYLSTIVGAIITVAGVVFSLTILTVSSASNQFGPRILNNFMRDKANQFTLGIYCATFVYASTVLLSLYEINGSGFTPYLSVFCSFLLALLCVGFLIFYIHHIPASLRIEHITSLIARDALKMIDARFPREEGCDCLEIDEGDKRWRDLKKLEKHLEHKGRSQKIGYVQAIDLESMLELAKRVDAIFLIKARPGDFLNGREALVFSDKKFSLKDTLDLESCFAVGADRTLSQNLMYLLSQLMEIAIRSMSPGINDPITAMSCVDWLEACLIKLGEDDLNRSFILDKDKNPRLILEPVSMEEALFQMRKGLAEHMSKSYATAMHMMEALHRLYLGASNDRQKSAIRACAAELLAFCRKGVPVKSQIRRLGEIFSSFSSNNLHYSHEYQ